MNTKRLIYGSCAMKYWYPTVRIPSDVDIISKNNDWIPAFQWLLDNNIDSQYVDPDLLYTIKCSHASWNIHWDKTIHDIVFLKKQGCRINQEFYDLLISDWKQVHKDKKIKLNVKNSEFFKSTITRKIDHDLLHEYLSFYDRPLHEKIRLDLNSPLCSKELFTNLSFNDRIRCAVEEHRVISTERFIFNGYPLKYSKFNGLKLLITSLTKGWFNQFLIDNFEILMNYEDITWNDKLKTINNF